MFLKFRSCLEVRSYGCYGDDIVVDFFVDFEWVCIECEEGY